ncbi:MAG: acyl-phosphate glycerol 3-phosphate acyltransferase [Variovorax sp.]|nr:MAG: acyl-phosphate glycerol 3-phosphate acyltransferase [Variovorax sp.]
MAGDPSASEAPVLPDRSGELLQLVRSLADELHRGTGFSHSLGLDHSLTRDYGLDSLARAELLLRIEREFDTAFAEASFTEAETPRDLLRALALAPAAGGAFVAMPEPAAEATEIEICCPPDSIATLVDVLDWHAEHHGDRLLVTFDSDDGPITQLSYARLQADALAVAAWLAEQGFGAGDAVAVMLPTGSDFFAAFYGAQYAGCVPVPLYPPARLSQLEDHLRRLSAILCNAEASVLITVAQAKPLTRLLNAHCETLRQVVTVTDLVAAGAPAAPFVRPAIRSDATAFLQYTSGSTGSPKGVVVSHANLLANVRAMRRAAQITGSDTFLSWLPLYHDLGLIGACIGSLYVGYRLVLMSPLDFLARPSRWLRAIHRHRASVSAAPNFAYELCLNKLADADLEGLDLSCWRLAFNGAEPVSADTIERFASRFAHCGFRREAMFTVYGLAEGVLGVTFPPLGRGPLVDRVDRSALLERGVARPAAAGDAKALQVVSCGLPLPGIEVRVVDAAAQELPERAQGRIQFRGPSATSGYYRNPAANAALIDGEWLNTGDLGYFAAGELYLTGREKDVIVRRGANIHPADLESALASLPGVRKGGVAVFPATDALSGSERLVVLAEVRDADAQAHRQIRAAITAAAVDQIGMPPDDIVIAPPGTVLKTSSGKIRRATARELYEKGALGRSQRAPWRQLVRLVAGAAAAQAQRSTRSAVRLAWACWAGAVFSLAGIGAWLTTMVLPDIALRRRAAHAWARSATRLAGVQVRIEGIERLPASSAALLVANHASYADSILLTAALPPRFGYVAKRELAAAVVLGVMLKRLGAVFVERADAAGAVEDTAVLESHARAGEPLVVFPEGTLRRAPGVLPFKLGAFVVAAHTATPVIPVALIGTRSLLRAGQWLPRRTEVVIEVGVPIVASQQDWAAAVALRDAARQAILERVPEPDTGMDLEPAGAPAV